MDMLPCCIRDPVPCVLLCAEAAACKKRAGSTDGQSRLCSGEGGGPAGGGSETGTQTDS